MMPPCTPWPGFGRWCFFTTLMPSTRTRSSVCTCKTVPRRPLSRPAMTITSSPFLICGMVSRSFRSQHFGCERDDLHELVRAQLARHRAEDAGTDRLQLVREQDRGVAVEPDERSVGSAHTLARADDDGAV